MRNIEVGITDKFDPEVQAMLLAMYSRSFAPISSRLPDTQESAQEHKKKLGKYYVQWGHKSVGQLGFTTVWLEGVSQLAAKAIEDVPLFNGQESSTRYINYGNQTSIAPNESQECDEEVSHWQAKWMEFYNEARPAIIEKLMVDYPFEVSYPDHESMTDVDCEKAKTTWKNTINARAFDMCRGFLPAGSVTNVGFLGTFDTLNDHFGQMLHHPCHEMRQIAVEVLTKMKEKYPYGTMDVEDLRKRFSYVDAQYFYTDGSSCRGGEQVYMDHHDFASRDEEHAKQVNERVIARFLMGREKGQRIDRVTSSKFTFTMRGLIDFGSYRDLHRHRAGVCDMNVLSNEFGLHEFYYDYLPAELKEKVNALIHEFNNWYIKAKEKYSVYSLQYAIPMGFIMHVTYKCDLNQMLYLLELRTGKTVHQTLRWLCQQWASEVYKLLGNGLHLHCDFDEDNFTLKRGTQTIVEETKEEVAQQAKEEKAAFEIEQDKTTEEIQELAAKSATNIH